MCIRSGLLDGDTSGDSMSNLDSYSMIFIRDSCISYAVRNDTRNDVCWRKQNEEVTLRIDLLANLLCITVILFRYLKEISLKYYFQKSL